MVQYNDIGAVQRGGDTYYPGGVPFRRGMDIGAIQAAQPTIYETMDQGLRMTGTTGAAATEVHLTFGPYAFSAGDSIRIVGYFDAADAGSKWQKDKCSISIKKV